MTFNELLDELQAIGKLFEQGKGGLWVTKTANGAIIQKFNKKNFPVRFSQAEIDWLVQRFPQLMNVLSRNMETLRRVQGIKSRLSVFLGGAFTPSKDVSPLTYDATTKQTRPMNEAEKKFVESLPGRKYAYLESLDPDPKRKVPTSLEELEKISATQPELLPRNFTVVDITDPKNPRRRIFQSEFDTGGLRTDEAVISYKVSPEEMDALANGKTFKSDIRNMLVENLEVLYFDLNKRITGETLLKHHIKTIQTGASAATKFLADYGVKLTGKMTLATREIYLQATHVSVTGSGVSVGRRKVDMAEEVDHMTTTSIKLESSIVEGQQQLIPQFEAKGMSALRNLSEQQVRRFVAELENVAGGLIASAKRAF